MSAAAASMDVVFLAGGAAVELQHLWYFDLWSPGENPRSGLPDRMMVLCLRQHYLLGGVILEAQTMAPVAVVWFRLVRLVVVMRPAWGRRWCISFSGVSLGCPSCGLRLVAVHAQDPPMVAVVLR